MQPSTPNTKPLSETCRRLAERIAGLIDRTLDIYEQDLAEIEADQQCRSGALAGQKSENHEDQGGPAGQLPAQRPPRNTDMRKMRTSLLQGLKGLVSTMEALLRIADRAHELEERDREQQQRETRMLRRKAQEILGPNNRDTEKENQLIEELRIEYHAEKQKKRLQQIQLENNYTLTSHQKPP